MANYYTEGLSQLRYSETREEWKQGIPYRRRFEDFELQLNNHETRLLRNVNS